MLFRVVMVVGRLELEGKGKRKSFLQDGASTSGKVRSRGSGWNCNVNPIAEFSCAFLSLKLLS